MLLLTAQATVPVLSIHSYWVVKNGDQAKLLRKVIHFKHEMKCRAGKVHSLFLKQWEAAVMRQ